MKYLFQKRRWQILVRLLDGFGYLVSGFPSGREKLPKNFKSVLIVRLDHLGDMVRASAMPQLIKESCPQARVIFLTNTPGAQLLSGNPYVDEVIVFDPTWYSIGSHKVEAKGDSFGSVVRRLKEMRIDLALLPRGDIRENLLAKMAKISYRIGYGVTGGGFLLSKQVAYRDDVHEDVHTLDIVRAIGVGARSLQPCIYADASSSRELGSDAIGIHLEAGTPAKEWDLKEKKKFLDLCEKRLPHANIYFVGQSKEVADLLDRQVMSNKALAWKNWVGKTSIGELKGLLTKTKVFVGFDSGPAHMAAAMGVTTLFIYSGTNAFDKWKPTVGDVSVMQNKVDCSPCHLAKCNIDGHPCLSGVDRNLVVDWIKERF